MQVITDLTYDLLSVPTLLAITAVIVMLMIPKVGVFALKLGGQAAVGALLILGLNWALGGFDLFVGLNVITVTVAGLLGLPGVVSLYILVMLI